MQLCYEYIRFSELNCSQPYGAWLRGCKRIVKLTHRGQHGGSEVVMSTIDLLGPYDGLLQAGAKGTRAPPSILSTFLPPSYTAANCSRPNQWVTGTGFYSSPQCSHCKRCTSYGNSVCLSVRLSVTRRYCVKMTARSTVQFALSDSKMCLVL